MSTKALSKVDSTKKEYNAAVDPKADVDDIESLLTVHVMCKKQEVSTPVHKDEKNTESESSSESHKGYKRTTRRQTQHQIQQAKLSQPIVLLERNIEQKVQESVQSQQKRKRASSTTVIRDTKKSKGELNVPKIKVVAKPRENREVDRKTSSYNTRRPNLAFLKVKSEEALGVSDKPSVEKLNTRKKLSSERERLMRCSCRLCGATNKSRVFIFSKNNELLEKIKTHLQIQLTPSAKLSQHVCSTCASTVISWSQFYKECASFQRQIETYMKKHKLEEIKTPPKLPISPPKSSVFKEPVKDDVKKINPPEDNIEKMLREMHGMDDEHSENETADETAVPSSQDTNVFGESGEENEEDDYDFNMDDVEFLDEERELVDQALNSQKMLKPSISNKSELTNGKKIIRMDRKLSEDELRSLLEKTGYNDVSSVTVMKTNDQSTTSADIAKHYTNFKDKLKNEDAIKSKAETEEDEEFDKEYYSTISKSYAHLVLENIQTNSELFFRCPDCRIYLPSSELPRHVQSEHKKLTALCDFCGLLFPYNTASCKNLVREHIQLHQAKKMKNHKDVISNICKLLESVQDVATSVNQSPTKIKQEDSPDNYVSLENKRMIQKNRYRCNQCPARFASAIQIREHLKLHKTETVICDKCSLKFTSRFALQSHEKSVHDKSGKQLSCEHCNLEFEDEKTYEAHMKVEQSLNPTEFVCPHCSTVYTDKEAMLKHIKTHPEQTFICNVCDLGYATNDELTNHQKSLHCYNTLKCVKCGYKNFTKIGLKNHMRNAHPDTIIPTLPFACDHCSQSFHTAGKLREHVHRTHQAPHGRNFQCPLCDWSFNHQVNLQKHFDCHVDKNHVKCKVCHVPFPHAGARLEIADVVAHKETHTPEENFAYQRPYSPSVSRMTPWREAIQGGGRLFCRDCGVACATPLELRKHQKIHKPFYCATCHTVSNNEQTFLLHMEQHADRKYGCKTCGKRFMTRAALNLHLRTHVDSPKFECTVCSRRFRIVTDWKRHERSCRESHGLPRMEYETNTTASSNSPNRQRIKRIRKDSQNVLSNVQFDVESGQLVEYLEDGSNITYEYIEDDGSMSGVYNNTGEENETYYVVQGENDDETIEIDENQLAEFQEWQRTAAVKQEVPTEGIATKIITEDGITTTTTENDSPVYYIQEVHEDDGDKFHFVRKYVETVDAPASTEDSAENSNIILNTTSNEEENVVYVDSSNNIVYNIQNSMITENMENIANINIGGQNIIFQQEEQGVSTVEATDDVHYQVFSEEGQHEEGDQQSHIQEEQPAESTETVFSKQDETEEPQEVIQEQMSVEEEDTTSQIENNTNTTEVINDS